jgi:hypothetical protein
VCHWPGSGIALVGRPQTDVARVRKVASLLLNGAVTRPHELTDGCDALRGTGISAKWPPRSSPACLPCAAASLSPSGPNRSGEVKNGCAAHSFAPLPSVKS